MGDTFWLTVTDNWCASAGPEPIPCRRPCVTAWRGSIDVGDRSRRTTWWAVVVGALWLVAAVCVLVAVIVTRSNDDDVTEPEPEPTPDAIRLEPVTYQNPSSFTDSIVAVPLDQMPELVSQVVATHPPASTGGTVGGDADLLYASRRGQTVCDGAALVRELGSDPELAAAWASAANVTPDEVTAVVGGLTPVVLTLDTAVTNHSYASGESRAYQAVLQAGTPVMVDATGMPRVKCSCGNPLAEPTADRPTATDGDAWDAFEQDAVVTVTPAAAPAPTLATVDLDTAQPSTTATGTNLALDGTLVAANDGLHVSSPDGQLVKVLEEEVDAVVDDGRGGLLYTLADPGNAYRSELPTSDATATVWHLPAGATEAVPFVPPAPGGWNQLLTAGRVGDRTWVVYMSYVLKTEYGTEEHASGVAIARDLDTGADVTLPDVGAAWESGVAATSIGADRLAFAEMAEIYEFWSLFGPDMQPLTNVCNSVDLLEFDVDQGAKPCPGRGVLDEQGRIIGLSTQDDPEKPTSVIWSDPVTGGKGSGATLQGDAVDGEYESSPHQARGGRLVLSTPAGDSQYAGEGNWQIFDLESGDEVTPELGDRRIYQLWIPSAPIIRPTLTG